MFFIRNYQGIIIDTVNNKFEFSLFVRRLSPLSVNNPQKNRDKEKYIMSKGLEVRDFIIGVKEIEKFRKKIENDTKKSEYTG